LQQLGRDKNNRGSNARDASNSRAACSSRDGIKATEAAIAEMSATAEMPVAAGTPTAASTSATAGTTAAAETQEAGLIRISICFFVFLDYTIGILSEVPCTSDFPKSFLRRHILKLSCDDVIANIDVRGAHTYWALSSPDINA
jgi:hypothetical protein